MSGLAMGLGIVLVVVTLTGPADGPLAVPAIPDEPGVVILADSIFSTVQAVAADLDGDDVREIVRLGGRTSDSVFVEAWRWGDDGGWARTPRVVVTAAQGPNEERAFAGRPVRLLLRAVDGADRVTLVRQPDELDDEVGCCLLLDDLRLVGGELRLVSVAGRGGVADAIHAVDFDGDGTDEILATRSLPPLADVSYPTEARIYRWTGEAFAEPTTTELPIGSGDTPFILGDTDGVSGAEVGIIAVTGRPELYRLIPDGRDRVHAEAAGLVVTGALAVPVGTSRGVAVIGPAGGLAVRPWPRGGPVRTAVVEVPMQGGELLGVAGGTKPRVLARTEAGETLAIDLERLVAQPLDPRTPSSLGPLADTLLRPFAGTIPGGGPDGAPAVMADGQLHSEASAREVAMLAGAQAIGFVGPGRSWFAVLHAPGSDRASDPRGGRLLPASFSPDTMLVAAPAEVVLAAEADGGSLSPRTSAGSLLDDGRLAVTDGPFTVDVGGPVGTRAYLGDPTSIGSGQRSSLRAEGNDRLVIVPPGAGDAAERTVAITLVTPAGHAYRAEWQLLVISASPELEVRTETPLGSQEVVVSGRTAPYATVSVAGVPTRIDGQGRFRAVVPMPPWPTSAVVTARDPLGNETVRVATGIGLFDYRVLPWVPIVSALVILAGVLLYLRVPRPRGRGALVAGDAVLEELDPDRAD